MTAETELELPGFDLPPNAGEAERAVSAQVEALRQLRLVEPRHQGSVTLAIITARALDRTTTGGRNAASGIANLSRALREALEALPQPEGVQGDQFERIVAAIMEADEAPE